ncbi:Putative ATP:guanido phosphotransferase YacI [hydrothermal vent metagenome]|uniref:Putative ATP:guanido phosphotransferase YacI n=1 Tax=hydrothermal vent metagenome TaxID=652676 RepID=A0A1W1C0C7_9ZZZZ
MSSQYHISIPENCRSLMCKYLTPEIYTKLREKKTPNGFTLDMAIKSGLSNPDSSIGIYAGDKESYDIFAPIFNPIIKEYHGFEPNEYHQSDLDATHLDISDPDPDGKHILSTRIRVGRNIKDMPLGAAITKEQRDSVESQIVDALTLLEGELEGDYYPLLNMPTDTQNRLISDHFLFKEGDRFLDAAGLNRDWPSGRGIYHNRDKSFLVWVNEEDQLRIISMQKGGNIAEVFGRLATAIKSIEKRLSFSYSNHLGYITSCPTNLGTAMRASVHISLPNLSKDMDRFKSITDKYHLQIRGVNGEHSESKGGVYDISNRRRLGVTEIDAVLDMYHGVVALIEEERR